MVDEVDAVRPSLPKLRRKWGASCMILSNFLQRHEVSAVQPGHMTLWPPVVKVHGVLP